MGLVVQIKVKPQSRVSSLTQEADGSWLAHIKSMPVDGKANEELIKWFAKRLGLNAACIELLSGQSSKQKRLKIKSISSDELLRLLLLN